MSTHTNFDITITHPITEEEVDAVISFYYYKGHDGSWDEPPSDPELELSSCVVDGEDILDQFEAWQVSNIESSIMEGMFNDDDFDQPDKDDYDEEWSYNVA